MTPIADRSAPLALTRLYALVSLIGVILAAVALTLLYRGLSIGVISEFGEQSNIAVAKTVLNGVYPELVDSLQPGAATAPAAATTGRAAIPPAMVPLIRELIRDTPVERIKVFNGDGIVLYSSRAHEIGRDESANPLIRSALGGEIESRLSYRDTFNILDRGDADDNLIETYVPVLDHHSDRPIGVFEIYTSVDTVAAAMARNELVIILGIGVILVLLYGSLLYVVRRCESIITRQRQTIVERNHTLEVLSARLLATEDSERRRIATELHEDIAQTLCAAKIKVEAMAEGSQHTPAADLGREIVPLVQQAIGDVRALAMNLRPSALDDFGLLVTIRELCQEARVQDPSRRVSAECSAHEDEVPATLKGLIFRILQETIKQLLSGPPTDSLRIALAVQGDDLELRAELDQGPGPAATGGDPHLAAIWERAVLSGAALDLTRTAPGTIRYRARWAL